MTLQNKTIFITGASRGIGREIALKAAVQGAKIVIAAKTTQPHPTLEGTIYTVAAEIEAAGGYALPLALDIRYEDDIRGAVETAVKTFGGIDILVNNASAIKLTGTLETPLKSFDLMSSVNVRGTFAVSQACIPFLKQSSNPHILNLSPPLTMTSKWFKNHCAYTLSKYGMSMCVLGMAEEFRKDGIAVNALWPRTAIATAALRMIGGDVLLPGTRYPAIVADAACEILSRPSAECTGNFFIDEDILREKGVTDFQAYALNPNKPLINDFFLD